MCVKACCTYIVNLVSISYVYVYINTHMYTYLSESLAGCRFTPNMDSFLAFYKSCHSVSAGV